MKYDYAFVQDGQKYNAGEEVPDMGSIICVESKGNIRSYNALSSDANKLPKYVETGSSCLMLDTGDFYKFERTTQKWYKL